MEADLDWRRYSVGSVPGLSPGDGAVWYERDAPRPGGI